MSGIDWVDSVLPAPSWMRSSQVTWFRSWLFSTITTRCGFDQSRQYFAMVIISLMPFICIAPSPMKAITVRSGKAIFAAMA